MSNKSPITTHILDLGLGRPACAVPVVLEIRNESGWQQLARGETDDDGRIVKWFDERLTAGDYRLVFNTDLYYQRQGQTAFFPDVTLTFRVDDPLGHYHVPLLLNRWGYSTYRGS